jgi:ribosomal protein S18 acetylase RimI-like enzyme
MPDLIELRWSRAEDAEALAALHRAAWTNAYAGVIPGPELARMLGRRGPRWWRALHETGERAMVADMGEGPVGYARLGDARRRDRGTGEIYELYLLPEYQGVGLGRRLFGGAREALGESGRPRLVVRALAENAAACRFYRAMGGREAGRGREVIGGRRLETVSFVWE